MPGDIELMLIGDVVGAPGRAAAKAAIAKARAAGRANVVVLNAENAAAGRGITPGIANELFAAGADIITLGDHAWDQKEIMPHLAVEPRLLRPVNLPPGAPGRGWTTLATPQGPVTVVNLQGRVFMPPVCDCPFRGMDALLAALPPAHGPVIVDFHAEATSEKIALGRHLDGRVSAVAGTHTHVQTSDETILPKGTAYITDLGMCGPKNSVLGRAVGPAMRRFLTGLPARLEIAEGPSVCEGLYVRIKPTGLAVQVERFRELLQP